MKRTLLTLLAFPILFICSCASLQQQAQGPFPREKIELVIEYVGEVGNKGYDRLSDPAGCAVMNDGTVVVTDPGLGRIMAFDADGDFLPRYFKAFPNEFLSKPAGIVKRSDSELYVTDLWNPAVYALDVRMRRLLDVQEEIGKTAHVDLELSEPHGVAVDKGGSLYITDGGSDRLLKIGPLMNLEWVVRNVSYSNMILRSPRSVAVLGDKVFVSDGWSDLIWILKAIDGRCVGVIKEIVTSDGIRVLKGTSGLATDEDDGLLLIAESGNNRITFVNGFGEWIAEASGSTSEPVGIGLSGMMTSPDRSIYRNLYVVDKGKRCLVKYKIKYTRKEGNKN